MCVWHVRATDLKAQFKLQVSGGRGLSAVPRGRRPWVTQHPLHRRQALLLP